MGVWVSCKVDVVLTIGSLSDVCNATKNDCVFSAGVTPGVNLNSPPHPTNDPCNNTNHYLIIPSRIRLCTPVAHPYTHLARAYKHAHAQQQPYYSLQLTIQQPRPVHDGCVFRRSSSTLFCSCRGVYARRVEIVQDPPPNNLILRTHRHSLAKH